MCSAADEHLSLPDGLFVGLIVEAIETVDARRANGKPQPPTTAAPENTMRWRCRYCGGAIPVAARVCPTCGNGKSKQTYEHSMLSIRTIRHACWSNVRRHQ
jgi:hypothetical protein